MPAELPFFFPVFFHFCEFVRARLLEVGTASDFFFFLLFPIASAADVDADAVDDPNFLFLATDFQQSSQFCACCSARSAFCSSLPRKASTCVILATVASTKSAVASAKAVSSASASRMTSSASTAPILRPSRLGLAKTVTETARKRLRQAFIPCERSTMPSSNLQNNT